MCLNPIRRLGHTRARIFYYFVFSILFNKTPVDSPKRCEMLFQPQSRGVAPRNGREEKMKKDQTERHEADEFEPIALGSVTEETKGGGTILFESQEHPNSLV